MKTSQKGISFILGFVLSWVVISGLFSTLVFHKGPIEILTLIARLARNPRLTGGPIENPLGAIAGEFVVTYDDYQNPETPTIYICANDEEHAKQMMEDNFFLSSGSYSERYSADEAGSADWQVYPEYISGTFARVLGASNQWNILRCDYFVVETTYPSYQSVHTAKLGTFKEKPTQEALNHLVWLLMRAGVIQMQGPFGGAAIDKIEVYETAEEIVRLDQGIYSVANDVWPYETLRWKVEHEYLLRKSDGALFYSRAEK